MASIRNYKTKSGATRYEVVYRGPDGRQRSKSFVRKVEANRFSNTVEADLARNDWLDPQKGRAHFGELAAIWLKSTTHLKPTTRQGYESIVAKHLLPKFGSRPVASIDHAEILVFISGLTEAGAGPGTVRNIRDVTRMIFKFAVRSGAVKTNPVFDIKVPRKHPEEMMFLTPEEVMNLAAAITKPPIRMRGGEHRRDSYPEYGTLVRLAAFTGLRAGEIVGLRAGRVDLKRNRVEVVETVTEAHGKLQFGSTKTYARRVVPVPPPIVAELAMIINGRPEDSLIFVGPNGSALRHSNWYPRHFKPATRVAELDTRTRFHDLRHTYAAFLIAQNAHPRAMMERLGHSTINVTLGTYGHLLPNVEAELEDAINELYDHAARP